MGYTLHIQVGVLGGVQLEFIGIGIGTSERGHNDTI